MSNKFLDIRPSNLPPNGIVSYKAGNPVITFDISEDDAAHLSVLVVISPSRLMGQIPLQLPPLQQDQHWPWIVV